MFFTSVWSGHSKTNFTMSSQCGLMVDPDGLVANKPMQ